MTAVRVLQLNGDLHDSPLMEVVRRFHALSTARDLRYCVVGGIAVVRNGYPRTTTAVDVLTHKEQWLKVLPLEGEISSEGIDSCRDRRTGVRIDILFAEENWGMPTRMPDPAAVGEFGEDLGAVFMGFTRWYS